MLITLNRESTAPIYLQIADAIHEYIERWQLAPRTRMPSIRDLSLQLNVSKFTIEKAYQALSHQGIVKISRANGTFVDAVQRLPGLEAGEVLLGSSYFQVDESKLSNYGKMLIADAVPPPQTFEQPTAPAPEIEVAIVKWPETISRARKEVRHFPIFDFSPQDLALRQRVASYVFRTRGINCSSNEILLFNSKFAALDALARVLLNHGDTVAIEDPSCPKVRAIFTANGAILRPIPTDSGGMQIEYVAASAQTSKFIYLSPTSNAVGQQLSETRRKMIVDVANLEDSYIIEDDCGHELRYNLSPLPALKANDVNRVVIYLADFDDVMFSALNCAYLVLPENLTALFARDQMLTQRTTYDFSHAAMALFMAEGHYDKHLRRLRLRYSRRRKMLIETINSKLGGIASIVSSKRTSLIVRFDRSIDQGKILSNAMENGLPCRPTDELYLNNARENEFEIYFAYLGDEVFEERLTAFAIALATRRVGLPQADFAAPTIVHPSDFYSFSK